jgi:hypothetical protein
MSIYYNFNLSIRTEDRMDMPTKEEYDILSKFSRDYQMCDQYGKFYDTYSWKNHEEVLKEFSEKNKDHLFILDVVAEGNEFIYKKYFMNGRMHKQNGKIVYDNFDQDAFEYANM